MDFRRSRGWSGKWSVGPNHFCQGMHGKGTAATHFRAGYSGASARSFYERPAAHQAESGAFREVPYVRTLGGFGTKYLEQGGVCAARGLGFAQGFFQHARHFRLKNALNEKGGNHRAVGSLPFATVGGGFDRPCGPTAQNRGQLLQRIKSAVECCSALLPGGVHVGMGQLVQEGQEKSIGRQVPVHPNAGGFAVVRGPEVSPFGAARRHGVNGTCECLCQRNHQFRGALVGQQGNPFHRDAEKCGQSQPRAPPQAVAAVASATSAKTAKRVVKARFIPVKIT